MSPNPSLTAALIANIPVAPQTPSIWSATTLTLKRNLARFHFPTKMSAAELDQSNSILKQALTSLPELKLGQFYEEKPLSVSDKELLYEHFLFLRGFQQNLSGSGLVVDPKGELLALFNGSNHLELRAICTGGNSDACWSRLQKMDAALGNELEYAFSPKFGYLTSDPTQCGTGLNVQAYLHLPALIHTNQLAALLPKEEDELLVMGLAGDLEELVGDFIILKNDYTLAVTEEAILQSIQTTSTKLVGAEKAQRAKLKANPDPYIKDLVAKSYGLLIHAYQLELKEALNYLSLMKLGLDLGLITGSTDQKISELFFKCRRGHLTHLFPELSEKIEELEHRRAEFLHKELQGLQLAPSLQ